jgi:transcriptional regulator GlxA family with amidase domain
LVHLVPDNCSTHPRGNRLWSREAEVQESRPRCPGLADSTFKRRFTQATGLAPIHYVQRLRIEDAKRRLERTEVSVDEISWQMGYEEPALCRRLFKRLTGVTPGAYRRRFRIPDFAR